MTYASALAVNKIRGIVRAHNFLYAFPLRLVTQALGVDTFLM